jgi:hypothetical protein
MERNPQPGASAAFLHARWPRYVFPLLIGGGAFGAGILLDVALGIENRPILYSDVFAGTMAAVLSFLVGWYYERLRRSDAERLRVAADVNHHVRNALTTVLYSVHVKGDAELIQVTQGAVKRIDWILREVLWETDEDPSANTSVWRDSDS